jgi:TolB protein
MMSSHSSRSQITFVNLCRLLLVLAAQPCASSPAIPVHVEPLAGSTGASISTLIETNLLASGALALTARRSKTAVVSGTVSGTRLEGRLIAPDGSELLRTLYDGPDLRRGAHELADDIVFALTGQPGIATSRIAFVSDASGRPEIYVCEADGRERRRVTYDGAVAAHPSLDRMGSLLTYTSHQGAQFDVFALDLNEGVRRRVVTASGGNGGASLSPDNQKLAVCMADTGWPTLVVLSLPGSEARPRARSLSLSRPGSLPSSPSWSPDGRHVVFSCDEGQGAGPQLYEVRPGHRSRRLSLGVSSAFSPDWAPDGERLVFVTQHRGALWIALWHPGGARIRLLGPGRDPCWGADSRHILYSTGDRLVRLNVDSHRQHTLIEGFGRLSEPSWTK